jgi:hypothetical protein
VCGSEQSVRDILGLELSSLCTIAATVKGAEITGPRAGSWGLATCVHSRISMPNGSHDGQHAHLVPCPTCRSLEPVTFERFGAVTVFCQECRQSWDLTRRPEATVPNPDLLRPTPDRRQGNDRRRVRRTGRRLTDLHPQPLTGQLQATVTTSSPPINRRKTKNQIEPSAAAAVPSVFRMFRVFESTQIACPLCRCDDVRVAVNVAAIMLCRCRQCAAAFVITFPNPHGAC